jgi:HNH endonuclease
MKRFRDMSVAERFSRQWIPEPNSGCHLWLGAVADTGYGKMIAFGQPKASAHRVSWILNKGPVPAGLWVLHTCDVRLCVNPEHLFLGTAADNTNDMMKKERHRTNPNLGVNNHNARLDDHAVRFIRASSDTGVDLAARYGVTPRVVYLVRNGQTWRHVQ